MELTMQQLKQYDGTDPSKPIYVAIKGRIFASPPASPAIFAGKDASRALAQMSKDEDDVVSSLDGLSDMELGVLSDWEVKFEAKYPIVGSVKN